MALLRKVNRPKFRILFCLAALGAFLVFFYALPEDAQAFAGASADCNGDGVDDINCSASGSHCVGSDSNAERPGYCICFGQGILNITDIDSCGPSSPVFL